MKRIECRYVDVFERRIYPASVEFNKEKILSIQEIDSTDGPYLVPGLIDAHIHIESSMLVPRRFAQEALKHGTIATVSDPHEIANVNGIEGVEYMIDNAREAPFYFYFGAPSCVPATNFETSGATIDSKDVLELLRKPEIHYLSEMMNYPGVIYKDGEVMEKINYAHSLDMKIDGHAPGLRGEDLKKYFEVGISTDHECFSYDEAKEKAELGMHILIREGSAAKNYSALKNIISEFPDKVMFCSDDKHPDDLIKGHINKLLARAVNDGFDFWDVLRAATVNPYRHYNLNHGLARTGDPSNFILVENLETWAIEKVYVKGECVFENGVVKYEPTQSKLLNRFYSYKLRPEDFDINSKYEKIKVIEARNGELITGTLVESLKNGNAESDVENDVLKISVVNRYEKTEPSVAFIKNFGLKRGAIASSVAHDSHNIISVGLDSSSICQAVNALMESKGGIAVYNGETCTVLPLPIAGLMCDESADDIGRKYEKLDALAKELGSELDAPFMTLSFMALLVIPELKLSDKGLFNGRDFCFESMDAS